MVTLSGHRGAVTALAFDENGTRLASGSRDTHLIVWDVVAETGLYRLKGHKDQITCLKFIKNPDDSTGSNSNSDYLLSSSKDTLLKLWDLSSQFCRETLVGHRTEVWSFDITADQKTIISGGAEPTLKAWTIDWQVLNASMEEVETKQENGEPSLEKAITLYGNIPRSTRDRIVTIKVHPCGKYFGVQAAGKVMELYRIRDKEEVKKKIQRRKKRAKEKGKDVEISDKVQAEDEFTRYNEIRASAKLRTFDFAPDTNVEKTGHLQVRKYFD